MDEYVLEYQMAKGLPNNVHPSWLKTCEKQTKDEVIRIIKKHLYPAGEYILFFYALNGRLYRHQSLFSGWVTIKGNLHNRSSLKPELDFTNVGPVKFNYYDDTMDGYDFKTEWPEIDCEKELTNTTAKFTVSYERIGPSPREFDAMIEKSADRFLKRLHNAVSFPLEIECDYPDVVFEICYDNAVEQSLAADTLKVIEDYVVKYNKRRQDGIHHVADVTDITEDKKPNAVYIHVDFGDCNVNVLANVIKAIGKSELPIKEMALK